MTGPDRLETLRLTLWVGLANGALGAPASPVRASRLTVREREILKGMAAGRTNQQIAEDLYLSENTIKTHGKKIFKKLLADTRAGAVAAAYRIGELEV